MKDYVLELVSQQTGLNAKLNIMREYLQAYVLKVMHNEGVFRTTAFLGGTALRFLYNLPRFSEDLDFSIVKKDGYKFVELVKKLRNELILAGYDISVSYNEKKTVQHAFFKFGGLMYETGISPLKDQKFSIKIEIDTNPPEGAILKTDVVNKYFPISFLSYDISSLFTGKLNALLCRGYTKGRDFFDIGWYLSKWRDLTPNMTLLQNGLKQTGWKKEMPTENNWRDFLYEVVKGANWKKVEQDVKNFLENPSDMNVFNKENVLKLILKNETLYSQTNASRNNTQIGGNT
ncbi:MAG: nucleotidyl transferase AbiEii/AbiGii toxin family protein [Planctomycetes bacterium]|nr:nucleotidyl transferase AbiEii/AbiGii toxin family protein [Planctomycetota bacterium]